MLDDLHDDLTPCALLRVDLSRIPLLPDPPINPGEVSVVEIGQPDWAEIAIEQLLYDCPIIIIPRGGSLVDSEIIYPRQLRYPQLPIWTQLRQILRLRGVDVPRSL